MNEKYFYFRMTDSFLQDERVRYMKLIPSVGYEFIVIYLELCLLAMKTGGIIKIPRVGEYSYVNILATDIGEDPKIVAQAFSYFLSQGLVEKVEEYDRWEIQLNYVLNNIGKSSNRADKLRLEYHQNKLPEPEEIREENLKRKSYGLMGNVNLTDEEYRELYISIPDIDELIKELDIRKAMGKDTDKSDFEEIRKIAKRWGK